MRRSSPGIERVPCIVTAVLALLAGWAAGAGAAPEEPRLRIASAGPFQAGDWVEIEFDGDFEDVREFEIMVSFDGGRSYPLQITPQLEPGTRRFFWRVPEVECSELHMRLRYERDGRETEAESSEGLAVAARGDASATARPAPVAVEAGEAPRPVRRGEPRPGGPTAPGEESEGLELQAPLRNHGACTRPPLTPALPRTAFQRPPSVSAVPPYTPPRN